MNSKNIIPIGLLMLISLTSCHRDKELPNLNIIFLHHSTGDHIWHGKPPSIFRKIIRKLSPGLDNKLSRNALLPSYINTYNKDNDKSYYIAEKEFPKASPYGWNNNPFDYYNIWVKNAGEEPFMKEPTLELLTNDYQVIIFKHCYLVSNILPAQDSADIDSYLHTTPNYKLQYLALRNKMHEFPDTKFILFTGAVQVRANLEEDEAERAREFFSWVKEEWDLDGDNIYLWDLYTLQTDGGLYFKDNYAISSSDSHPNTEFASKAAELLFKRIIDIVENNGTGTLLTGEKR